MDVRAVVVSSGLCRVSSCCGFLPAGWWVMVLHM
jgi:hypothetical protein